MPCMTINDSIVQMQWMLTTSMGRGLLRISEHQAVAISMRDETMIQSVGQEAAILTTEEEKEAIESIKPRIISMRLCRHHHGPITSTVAKTDYHIAVGRVVVRNSAIGSPSI